MRSSGTPFMKFGLVSRATIEVDHTLRFKVCKRGPERQSARQPKYRPVHITCGVGRHEPPSEISEWRSFMLEDYYVKPSTIDRVRSSWLAPQIESYLEWLQAHGYSRLVVYRRLPLLFHFAEFTREKGCRDVACCKAYIKEFVSQWLEQHGAKAKTAVAVRKHT